MAHVTLSAVQPLLLLIHNEAQLLRGVRGDVRFIKDEMESIKGFLLNLARTRDGDHQVRAWMGQVMEVAYDSMNCIEDYAQGGRPRRRDGRGLAALLLRVVRLPQRLLVRRRVAVRIRRLKVRVREIGERQQRYAVAFPRLASTGTSTDDGTSAAVVTADSPPQQQQQERRSSAPARPRRYSPPQHRGAATLDSLDSGVLTVAKSEVVLWLVKRVEERRQQWRRWSPTWLNSNVLGVVTDGANCAGAVQDHCRSSLLAGSGPISFDCIVGSIAIRQSSSPEAVVTEILRQILSDHTAVTSWDVDEVTRGLKPHSRNQRVLLLVSDMDCPETWGQVRSQLRHRLKCSDDSAVVFFTESAEVAEKCIATKTYLLADFYSKCLLADLGAKESSRHRPIIRKIFSKCSPDVHCMNLFLHAMRSNPSRSEQELESLLLLLRKPNSKKELDSLNALLSNPNTAEPQRELERSLDAGQHGAGAINNNRTQMMAFIYQGLHQDYQNCLWYSTVFNQGKSSIRRASLLRRWVAEDLIQRAGWPSSSIMAEAERCFDTLLAHDLLRPCNFDGTSKIKSCALVDEALVDANQLPESLQLHFSIRNALQLRTTAASSKKVTVDKMDMMACLKTLRTSSSFRLLRALELEGYKGFKKRHLKNICKIHQLKYLNLRNTDIKQLPEDMDQLGYLETLDIRGTGVRELNAVLPMLKNLLAGSVGIPTTRSQGDPAVVSRPRFRESFSTVHLRHGAVEMTNLEVLSHVKVSDIARDLSGVAEKLKMLRKLGVLLSGNGAATATLGSLFAEISRFDQGGLTSLSIRVEGQRVIRGEAVDATKLKLPSTLQSLRIVGITGWLTSSIKELRQLTKITLRETSLQVGALHILGTLRALACLRLLYHSLADRALDFEARQFRSLMDLVIEDDRIERITFAAASSPGETTAPKLAKMVWSFEHMECLSGVNNLPSLRRLELNRGIYDRDALEKLRQEIPNCVHFSLHPPEDCQADSGSTTTR